MGAAGRDVLAADTTAIRGGTIPDDADAASPAKAQALDEAEARRRARWLALVLMGASCIVTLAIVGALWLVLWGIP